MLTDPASYRLSRTPSTMNRPAQSPLGPRTRFQRSLTPDTGTARDPAPSPVGEPTPIYPLSPTRSDSSSLAPIVELSSTPPPLSSTSSTSSPTPPPTYKVLPKAAVLIPAPILNFDSVPIQWKAIPHEAALWTLDKHELQQLVSRALRRSAPETFIRLFSLADIETALPAEVDRLTQLKAVKQSRYRFLVHRRTMMLQALNSTFISPEKREADDGVSMAGQLALQLSQVVSECDQVMLELLVIGDQLAQISSMTEHHLASALGIALRKLNKSYAKRTGELMVAQDRIIQLEADLEDAWQEAERVAKEIDEIEKVELGSDEEEEEEEEAVIETAEKVTSRHASHIPATLLIQSRRNTAHMEALPMFSPLSPMPRMSAIATPEIAQLPPLQPTDSPTQDKIETGSIRSTRSTKSAKSVRSGRSIRSMRSPDSTRLSLVSAARTRSNRASKSSLRLPKKSSVSITRPPMPELPLEYTAGLSSRAPSSRSHWPGSADTYSAGRLRRTSMDDVRLTRLSTSSYTPTVTVDDIYVRLQSRPSEEIEIVRRTPPPMPQPPDQPSQTIPSMWLMSDTTLPKSAPNTERVSSIKRLGMPNQTYQKLKSYTKRYSLPFPLFKSKAAQSEAQSVSSSRSAPPGISE